MKNEIKVNPVYKPKLDKKKDNSLTENKKIKKTISFEEVLKSKSK